MHFIAPLVFAVLTLSMFFDVLFSGSRVVSAPGTDLAMQFIPWREFGFSELSHGRLPLWNPHIYGGTPYFAGFQSALLYPLNWLHLILPVSVAINWIVALHVFLAGYFTYLWCRGRELAIGGSILAGAMFMFSGPYFLHLYAGHLPHLAVMVWTPLMLLSLDKIAASGDLRWSLLGIVTATMQVLGGHPQYVYYTGIAMTLYLAIRTIDSRHRLKMAGGFVIMYAGAILLSAIQLFPGISVQSEMVRSGGTQYTFASTFSLPPENLVTLLTPGLFGTLPVGTGPTTMYWGAGYLWEMSLFVGVVGLALAVLGVVRGQRRPAIIAVAMVVLMMLLALGRHTPLYWPMFKYLPFYGSFRGTVKFAYLAVLFVSMLSAMGMDSLIRRQRLPLAVLIGAGVFAAILAGTALMTRTSAHAGLDGHWAQFVAGISKSAETGGEAFSKFQLDSPDFLADIGRHAAITLFISAGVVLVAGTLLWASRFHRFVPYALVLLATIELFVFARGVRGTSDEAGVTEIPSAWRDALTTLPSDQRVLTVPTPFANAGLSAGFDNLAGYDPGVLKRYAELIYASQGASVGEANQYLPWQRPTPGVFRMLRCGLVCFAPNQPPLRITQPLPAALLVSDWVQLKEGRDQILQYLSSASFDASKQVVLENWPDVQPTSSYSKGAAGTVTSRRLSSDETEITAELERPAILLITDNYSPGWRVRPLDPNPPQTYHIVAANYTQMAIALTAGKHHFMLEYSPNAFRIGRWVSLVAIVALAGTSFLLMRRRS